MKPIYFSRRVLLFIAIYFSALTAIPFAASGAYVESIDDDFTGTTTPWDSGKWNKAFQSSTESGTSPPGADEAFFSHDGTGSGVVSVEIDPDGTTTGAGIISRDALIPVGLHTVTASMTIESTSLQTRLILVSSPTLSFNHYIFASVSDIGSSLRVFVHNAATMLYNNTDIGAPVSVGAGDTLSMTCDSTHLISLTYYDASENNTILLVDESNKIAHGKDFENDFRVGIYLAAEIVSFGDAPARSLVVDRLQGSVVVDPLESFPLYDWNQATELHSGILHANLNLVSPRLLVINALRIDLHHPDIRLAHNQRAGSWVSDVTESVPTTTRQFITSCRAQGVNMVAAINANAFGGANVSAFAMDRGDVVSLPVEGQSKPSLFFDRAWNAHIEILPSGYDTSNILTAVTSFGPQGTHSFVLQNGYLSGLSDPDGSAPDGREPRTGIGLSEDSRFLVLMTIDGRQTISLGATMREVGYYLRFFGAFSGMNMDGGGSSTLANYEASTDSVELLNVPSDTLWGFERTVASNLGVYYIDQPEPITLSDWLIYRGVPADVRNPLDDPAGDGIPNLMSYALNIHPLLGVSGEDLNALPSATITNESGEMFFDYHYRINRHAVDLTVIVETTEDLLLNAWNTPLDLTTEPDGTDLVTGDARYRVRLPVAGRNHAFLKLRVETP